MEILNFCQISANGHNLIVPNAKDYKISKEGYAEFKKQMLNIKGIWKGNQTFEFPYKATEILNRIAKGETYDFRKLQLFPTPYDLAKSMFDSLCSEFRKQFDKSKIETMKVLEPSAGTGNLIYFLDSMGFKNIDYCEYCNEYDYILSSNTTGIKANKIGSDFLQLKDKNDCYDLVFANPPFSSDTKHLSKMLEVVKEGGFVVTLLGEGFYSKNAYDDFETFAKKYSSVFYCTCVSKSDSKNPEDWFFESTPSGYTMLVVQKQAQSSERKNKKAIKPNLTENKLLELA